MSDITDIPPGAEPYRAGDASERQYDEQATAEAQGPKAELAFWRAEIKAARNIERRWRREGDEAEKLFFGETETGFHDGRGGIETGAAVANSNLNTMRPAIFSQMPQINVKRRFRGDGKANSTLERKVATAAERLATYLVERGNAEAVFDRARDHWLTVGRAVTRVVYEAEIETAPETITDPMTGEARVFQIDRKVWEDVRLISWPWRDVVVGPATSWDRVPWIAFDAYMTRPEYDEMGFNVPSDRVTFAIEPDGHDGSDQQDRGLDAKLEDEEPEPSTSSTRNRTRVTEVWDRRNNRVIWICDGYAEGLIEETDDPLQLEYFWPIPEPLLGETIGDSMVPRPNVAYYRNQIEEIDTASRRLRKVLEAMKLRGLYPGEKQGEINRLFDGAEAISLRGITDFQALVGDKGGNLSNLLAWVPVDMLVAMANALVSMREQAKAQMYEITGISDIVRGHGNPNETATAQGLKGKFAGLRFGRSQARFARHVRDSVRIMLEVAVEHLDLETIADICQMDIPFSAAPVMDPQTGQVAPPEVSWEQIHQVLRDDLARSYIIQIETDDTLLADEEKDREARVQFLTAFVQSVNGLAPMLQSGLMPLSMFKQLLLFTIRGFRKARAIEDLIQELPEEMPQQDDGPGQDEIKMKIEQMRIEADAMLQKEKLGHAAVEADKDRAHQLKMKGVDLTAKAAEMQAQPAPEAPNAR